MKQLLYQIALTQLKGIGPKLSQILLQNFEQASSIFNAKRIDFEQIDQLGIKTITNIISSKDEALLIAKREVEFLKKNPQIQAIFYTDSSYPNRLKYCSDAPILLYSEGNMNLNYNKVISIVGTRKMTNYGKKMIKDFLFEIQEEDILVISGLAYGVDSQVHRTCVELGIPTVGVLAHGLDQLYPVTNKKLAAKMKENGGLLTEYLTKTTPNKENFPMRNRIVAGLSDATIIVESDRKGGSLITADIAFSYNRDVFAMPGRVDDQFSSGCNFLIKQQKALLIENAKDLFYHLGWNEEKKFKNRQKSLFVELTDEERIIANLIQSSPLTAEIISAKSTFPLSSVRTILLNLELKGLLRIVPGNQYLLN